MRSVRVVVFALAVAAPLCAQDPDAPYYPPPAAPDVAALPQSNRVDLSWAAVPGATSYKIRRSTNLNGPFAVIGTTTGVQFANTGLTNGTIYHYVVSALNGTSQTYSTIRSATPQAVVTHLLDPFDVMGSWTAYGSGVTTSIDASGGNPGGALRIAATASTGQAGRLRAHSQTMVNLTLGVDIRRSSTTANPQVMVSCSGGTQVRAWFTTSHLHYFNSTGGSTQVALGGGPWYRLEAVVAADRSLYWRLNGGPALPTGSFLLPDEQMFEVRLSSSFGGSANAWFDNLRITSP